MSKASKINTAPPPIDIPPELRTAYESTMFDVILTAGEVFLKGKNMTVGVNIPEEHWTTTRLWAGTMFLRSMLVAATEDEALVEKLFSLMKKIGEVTRPGLSDEKRQWIREHMEEN